MRGSSAEGEEDEGEGGGLRLGRRGESLLSSEPIYTGGNGSAASLHCLKRHAPAGKDGGRRGGEGRGAPGARPAIIASKSREAGND